MRLVRLAGLASLMLVALLALTGCSERAQNLLSEDQKFIQWYKTHAKIAINDLAQIRLALNLGNVEDAMIWTKEMKSDVEGLRKQCDSFKVSKELLSAKEHCMDFLLSMDRAAEKMLDFFENGNSESFDSALKDLEVAFNHLNLTETQIKAYCGLHDC